MRHWIEDPDCRDHFSVIYESGERTAIYANDAKESITVEERAVSACLKRSWREMTARLSWVGSKEGRLREQGLTLLDPLGLGRHTL